MSDLLTSAAIDLAGCPNPNGIADEFYPDMLDPNLLKAIVNFDANGITVIFVAEKNTSEEGFVDIPYDGTQETEEEFNEAVSAFVDDYVDRCDVPADSLIFYRSKEPRFNHVEAYGKAEDLYRANPEAFEAARGRFEDYLRESNDDVYQDDAARALDQLYVSLFEEVETETEQDPNQGAPVAVTEQPEKPFKIPEIPTEAWFGGIGFSVLASAALVGRNRRAFRRQAAALQLSINVADAPITEVITKFDDLVAGLPESEKAEYDLLFEEACDRQDEWTSGKKTFTETSSKMFGKKRAVKQAHDTLLVEFGDKITAAATLQAKFERLESQRGQLDGNFASLENMYTSAAATIEALVRPTDGSEAYTYPTIEVELRKISANIKLCKAMITRGYVGPVFEKIEELKHKVLEATNNAEQLPLIKQTALANVTWLNENAASLDELANSGVSAYAKISNQFHDSCKGMTVEHCARGAQNNTTVDAVTEEMQNLTADFSGESILARSQKIIETIELHKEARANYQAIIDHLALLEKLTIELPGRLDALADDHETAMSFVTRNAVDIVDTTEDEIAAVSGKIARLKEQMDIEPENGKKKPPLLAIEKARQELSEELGNLLFKAEGEARTNQAYLSEKDQLLAELTTLDRKAEHLLTTERKSIDSMSEADLDSIEIPDGSSVRREYHEALKNYVLVLRKAVQDAKSGISGAESDIRAEAARQRALAAAARQRAASTSLQIGGGGSRIGGTGISGRG